MDAKEAAKCGKIPRVGGALWCLQTPRPGWVTRRHLHTLRVGSEEVPHRGIYFQFQLELQLYHLVRHFLRTDPKCMEMTGDLAGKPGACGQSPLALRCLKAVLSRTAKSQYGREALDGKVLWAGCFKTRGVFRRAHAFFGQARLCKISTHANLCFGSRTLSKMSIDVI